MRVDSRLELEQAVFHLAAIVASSDDAIVSKNLDGIVQSWNPAAERLFGYKAEEMIGQSIRKIIPEDHEHEEDNVLAKVRSGERVDHFETIRQRKDGSLIPISLTVSPILDREGRIIGASKIARDITDKRAAEEAIAKSMALKDQFLGLVSHELRTPISTIIGNGQLLLRQLNRLPEGDRNQAIADIVGEGQRLQRIVENLLLLTRLEATGELQRESLDLGSLAREAVATLNRRNPGRSVSVEVEPDLPRAPGDPTLTLLVIENLVGNADKYSPREMGIEVSVRCNREDMPEVHVLDRGIGIEQDQVDAIFEAFFRATTARSIASGMGLGLAVSKRIVDAQGGSIQVESRPGGGSDFSFSLPAFWSHQGQPTTPRILVVDDDPAIVRMIRLALTAEGFEVEVARDGLEGLSQIGDNAFDAVILDLQMPHMDGRTMFREMRERGHDLPVLILSAYGAQTAQIALKAEAFMDKPFDSEILLERIRRLLDK